MLSTVGEGQCVLRESGAKTRVKKCSEVDRVECERCSNRENEGGGTGSAACTQN